MSKLMDKRDGAAGTGGAGQGTVKKLIPYGGYYQPDGGPTIRS